MTGTTEALRLFLIVLIIGNVLALIAGVSLMVVPKKIAKWLRLRATHPLSVRLLTKPFEKPRNSERVMLRYPRALGVTLLAGGLYVLIKSALFISSVSVLDGGRMLMQIFPGSALSAFVWESFWLAVLTLILLGALLAVTVGGLALVRVQTLKNFSTLANRWVSTRQAVKPVSRPYYGIDRFVAEHPQVLGGVITLLSVYTLVMIVWSMRA